MDNSKEVLPLVDNEGITIGKTTRAEAHGGSKLLHPVVHLHVFNCKGELYLQKRPAWKDIQPDKWDTACGGHVDYGETIAEALKREVCEELGIKEFIPVFLKKYVFESSREKELVNVFVTTYNGVVAPSVTELEGGRFWTIKQIEDNIGKNVFTPNFENEYNTILKGWLNQKQDNK